MQTVELTIDSSYLSGNSGWNAAAGIREILQNARDAEIEHRAKLSVSYDAKTRVLRIENRGVTLPRETLLIGCTSKRDRDDLAGQYGEGYKMGTLVLLRAGHTVKFRTGTETWTPAIRSSKAFGGREVLVFDIEGGRTDKQIVRVDIGNVDPEEWAATRENFLFLYNREIPSVETAHGTILTSDKFKGRVYVKGILVTTRHDLAYGYNLTNANLDRDRRILDSYDLESALRNIWLTAVESRPDMTADFAKLLEKRSAKDLAGMTNWYSDRVPAAAANAVAALFVERYGADAIPVANMAESKDVEHLGVRGVVVPAPLQAVLARKMGDLASVQERLRNEVTESYSWSDLDAAERQNLDEAIVLVNGHAPVTLDEVDIVAFRSKSLQGQFAKGRVLIAKKLLADRRETLATLVHEVAHKNGGDGDKNHVAEIERIWSGIVDGLRGAL